MACGQTPSAIIVIQKEGIMKKSMLSCCILLGCAVIFVGCNQSEPNQTDAEEQTVIRMEAEQGETKATQQENASVQTEGAAVVPDHVSEEILSSKRYGRVYIEADVINNIEGETCVQTILPGKISQADADFMLEHFFKGKTLSNATVEKTPEQIKAEIDELTRALQNPAELTEDDINGMELALEQLEEQRSSATGQKTGERATTQLAINPDSQNEALYVTADLGFSQASSLDIVNFRDGSFINFLVLYLDYDRIFLLSTAYAGKDAAGQAMTLNAAKEQALVYQKELQLSNLVLFDVQTGITEDQQSQGYIAIFRQGIGGCALAKPEILDFSGARPNLVEHWPSDEVRVKFDDQGISAIEWNNKGTLAGTPEPIETMPFQSILESAKQQLALKYAWNENVTYHTEVHVDQIALEYALIPKPEEAGSFLIVPAWNFYGNVRCHYEDGTSEEFYGERQDICHISINAVDGSVIS